MAKPFRITASEVSTPFEISFIGWEMFINTLKHWSMYNGMSQQFSLIELHLSAHEFHDIVHASSSTVTESLNKRIHLF